MSRASDRSPVGGEEQPEELTEDAEIVDPDGTDGYEDDPETPDVNEAKLDRATDEVAAEEETPAAPVRRRRATRPVRKSELAEAQIDPVDETSETSEGSRAVARKERATRRRKQAEAQRRSHEERTSPATFVNESVGELRKVVWPTGNQVQQYFVVVLVFVAFIIAFVSLLDLVFGWALLKVFG